VARNDESMGINVFGFDLFHSPIGKFPYARRARLVRSMIPPWIDE
jgi:hypothetical protein